MDELTIKVKYSCQGCGLQRTECAVPVRNADEDVLQWLNGICIPEVTKDHESKSPHCRSEEMSELLIPLVGVGYIGGASI